MFKSSPFALLGLSLMIGACATNSGANYEPLLDGDTSPAFKADLAECQALAEHRNYLNDDTRTDALIGAGIGALAGIADDDVNDTEGAIAGAIVGALAGGGARALETRDERKDIVVSCMQGRGHRAVG